MKVILTGSRDWPKRGPVLALMRGLAAEDGFEEFVLGDCPTGLDAIALKICEDLGYAHKKFIAHWDQYGRAAGPRRNGHMIAYARQNLSTRVICFAFRTDGISQGTDDCMAQARQAGVPTYLIRALPTYTMTVPGTKGYRYNSEVEGP